ncbi:MAG: hypothetical protein J0H15_01790 [Xanthomonadales bacterium]|nr:hypothetical protein [Xanthomonadales bacterium]
MAAQSNTPSITPERKTAKLDVVYVIGDGRRIEFSGPEPLGADDLRVLQGLVALAGPRGKMLPTTPKTAGGVELRERLEPRWDAVAENAIAYSGSYRRLAHEIGVADSGRHLELIRDSIERLWKVSIIAQSGGRRQGYHLLSTYAGNTETGQLRHGLRAGAPARAGAGTGAGAAGRGRTGARGAGGGAGGRARGRRDGLGLIHGVGGMSA